MNSVMNVRCTGVQRSAAVPVATRSVKAQARTKTTSRDTAVSPKQFDKKRGKNSAMPKDSRVPKSKINDVTGRPQTGRSWDLYLLIVAIVGIVVTSIINVQNVKPALEQTTEADQLRPNAPNIESQLDQRVLGPNGEKSEGAAVTDAIMN